MDTDKGREDKFLECLKKELPKWYKLRDRAEKEQNTPLKFVLYILHSLLAIVIMLVTIPYMSLSRCLLQYTHH